MAHILRATIVLPAATASVWSRPFIEEVGRVINVVQSRFMRGMGTWLTGSSETRYHMNGIFDITNNPGQEPEVETVFSLR